MSKVSLNLVQRIRKNRSGRTNERTNKQTNGRTDGQRKNYIPLPSATDKKNDDEVFYGKDFEKRIIFGGKTIRHF